MELYPTATGPDRRLIYNQKVYTRKRTTPTWIRWECSKRRTQNCKGGLTTDNRNPRRFKAHDCEVNNVMVEITKVRQNMRDHARANVGASTVNIIAAGIQTLTPEAVAVLPDLNIIKRDIQRQKAIHRPIEPVDLASINLVDSWTTIGGANPQPFLIHDSGPAAGINRILVFAYDEPLRHLASCRMRFMDGTFKVAPAIFMQLYVIRAKLDEGAISCVYCLLPGKGQLLYQELFTVVQRKMQNLGCIVNLNTITVDFEQAAYQATRYVFGVNLRINGCFYHLKQSIFRHAVDLGLRMYIVDGSNQLDPLIREFVGMIAALAFVLALNDIQRALQVLFANIPNPMITPLVEYFDESYVRGPMMNGQPRFQPALWNKYDITLNNHASGCRTNNICEGWNNAFNKLVGQQHPPLYKLIESMQKDYAQVNVTLTRSRNGNPLVTRVRQEVRLYNRNLHTYCLQYQQDFNANNMIGYLRLLSNNIRYR